MRYYVDSIHERIVRIVSDDDLQLESFVPAELLPSGCSEGDIIEGNLGRGCFRLANEEIKRKKRALYLKTIHVLEK
ncbi:MAG: hypothetical protein IJ091_01080 [Oscillospiraceae bacterium]|nr:hypothetical protein [Oscillospiraceae bacterium]